MKKEEALALFDEKLVILNDPSESEASLLESIGKRLYLEGYVKDTFADALKEREKNYPTGLRTIPYEIAIPHADEIHVLQEAIVIIRPKKGVEFREMATLDKYVNARFIFMLLLKKESRHAECLEILLEMAQDGAVMEGLEKSEDERAAFQLLKEYFNAH